jgi:hypothetical protein
MPEDNGQHVYTPQALEACEKALRTILTKIGPWGGRIFLIGGMTPRFLIGTAPIDIKEHIGTTDLDIVVGITVSTEEEELYRTLQNNLKDAGFAPAVDPETGQEQTFRWTRDVDGVGVFLEFFCPVGDGTAGRALRNPGSRLAPRSARCGCAARNSPHWIILSSPYGATLSTTAVFRRASKFA